jgi:hypothetical protein
MTSGAMSFGSVAIAANLYDVPGCALRVPEAPQGLVKRQLNRVRSTRTSLTITGWSVVRRSSAP